MKQKIIKKLTTSERLTLLEQIFAPHGGLEFASCTLSDMDYMFDFEKVNLIEMKCFSGEDELRNVIEHTNRLLLPETEQTIDLGMPYFVHANLPKEPILSQHFLKWLQHDEPIAMEHFVTTSDDTTVITIRIVLINKEISNKIADETFKNSRIKKNIRYHHEK